MRELRKTASLAAAVFATGMTAHAAPKVDFEVRLGEAGQPQYRLMLGGQPVLDWSALGLALGGEDLRGGFERLASADPVAIEEVYELVHGKQSRVTHRAQETVHTFTRPEGRALRVRARVSDGGVAFRYELDGKSTEPVTLEEEATTFVPAGGLQALVSHKQDGPGQWTPAYEYHMYGKGLQPQNHGYCFPMLLGDEARSVYLLLGEAGVGRAHCGFRLRYPEGGPLRIGLPDAAENPVGDPAGPVFTLPWASPWRLLIVGDRLADVVESTLPTDVAEPSRVPDTSWIKPGFASWSWWSNSSSPKHSKQLMAFFDLASDLGWEYSLVDANWSREAVPELVAYAREKGVRLFYWYNSGGEHNAIREQPRDCMADRETRRREMAWLREQGIAGIKVDFFNSDKQARIAQYLDILEDAAEFQLMVNFHGCTLPRGWERTYPHLMTMEAVRGGESYKFAGEWWNKLAPMHNVNVALTRNVMGPVDYTPGIVSRQGPKYRTLTTAAHELALGVVLHSGVTHWCDSVEAYRGLDPKVQELLRRLPRTWDETRLVSGKPADHVVLARRSGSTWYLAGISGRDEAMTVEIAWERFFPADGAIQVYGDAEGGSAITVTTGRTLRLEPFGGFIACAAEVKK